MNFKSNICIPSNIYNRSSELIGSDVNFVKNVTGHSALKVLNNMLTGTTIRAKLNNVQLQEVREGTTCSLAKNNEVTHGKVMLNGKIEWVCRCEYDECERFLTCEARKLFLQTTRNTNVTESNVLQDIAISADYFEYLGNDFNENMYDEPAESDSLTNEIYFNEIIEYGVENQNEFEQSKIQDFYNEFVKMPDGSNIIESEINSKIIVNAGPGTGKTYTVINRLLHIIENELATPDCILVLCYSRAAVAVIKDRILHGISNGHLPSEANTISIYTFDWFATKYLSEINIDMTDLSYNERISLFNKKINSQDFEHFEYLIVDEMQDLVNERALMVINILKSVNCGFLLLGDRCQAIYDYDCGTEKNIKSTEFYAMLNEMLDSNVLKYELTKNSRQNETLSKFTKEMREILLDNCEIKYQNELIQLAIDEIDVNPEFAEKFIPILNNDIKTAILCRNNGEAEKISSHLHKNKVKHTLIRGSNNKQKLHRWIADVFWDYTQTHINKTDFIERYTIRVCSDAQLATQLFAVMSKITNSYNDTISMDILTDTMQKMVDVEDELLAVCNDDLIVSTIHRAKGREFDKVYLLHNSYPIAENDTEESRVKYVAATRAKSELSMFKKRILMIVSLQPHLPIFHLNIAHL